MSMEEERARQEAASKRAAQANEQGTTPASAAAEKAQGNANMKFIY